MATQNDTGNDVINQLAELNRVYAELIGFIEVHETASQAVNRLLVELASYQIRERYEELPEPYKGVPSDIPLDPSPEDWPMPVRWPTITPTPPYTLSTQCPVCGIGADGAMGYVCTRVDCPSGFAVSSSTVKYDPSVPMTFTLGPLEQTLPFGDQQLTWRDPAPNAAVPSFSNTIPWTLKG
jgi:hypothetical protein